MLQFLGAPQWMSTSFPIIQTVLLVLIGISALAITIAILAQPSNPDGGRNVITGTNDSYYAQNKGATKEGRLKRLIIVSSIVILVLTIVV